MKSILTIFLILLEFNLFCQEANEAKHKIKVGINFSYFPETRILRFLGKDEHVPDIYGKDFYSAGIIGVIH
jgi:hypothetical protein